MLVSHRKQFIFIKSAKTAGTSVEEYFERWCLPEGGYAAAHLRPAEITPQGVVGARHKKFHATSGGYISHLIAESIRDKIGPEIWNRYFKFTCTRNPYDKAVSWFHMRLPKEDRQNLAEKDFERAREMFRNWLVILPSTPNDEPYAAIHGRIIVDGVIRYEHLMTDLETVCKRVNVPFDPDGMPRRKTGKRAGFPGYREYYTPETKAIIQERSAWEFETFGYDPDDV